MKKQTKFMHLKKTSQQSSIKAFTQKYSIPLNANKSNDPEDNPTDKAFETKIPVMTITNVYSAKDLSRESTQYACPTCKELSIQNKMLNNQINIIKESMAMQKELCNKKCMDLQDEIDTLRGKLAGFKAHFKSKCSLSPITHAASPKETNVPDAKKAPVIMVKKFAKQNSELRDYYTNKGSSNTGNNENSSTFESFKSCHKSCYRTLESMKNILKSQEFITEIYVNLIIQELLEKSQSLLSNEEKKEIIGLRSHKDKKEQMELISHYIELCNIEATDEKSLKEQADSQHQTLYSELNTFLQRFDEYTSFMKSFFELIQGNFQSLLIKN